GFDRLREAGFSEEDIERLREQFHQWRGNDNALEEDGGAFSSWLMVYLLRLTMLLAQGTYKALFYGLVIGFFGGLCPLFWFATNTFSRQRQLGLLAGLIINLTFGILHVYN
ncbi:hypothetical protein THASP1DRAFT_18894, partial [Thamnocephalis sphaerospora]